MPCSTKRVHPLKTSGTHLQRRGRVAAERDAERGGPRALLLQQRHTLAQRQQPYDAEGRAAQHQYAASGRRRGAVEGGGGGGGGGGGEGDGAYERKAERQALQWLQRAAEYLEGTESITTSVDIVSCGGRRRRREARSAEDRERATEGFADV